MYATTPSTTQFVDMDVSRDSLQSYLQECGYWANESLRTRYKYELSPSAYVVSKTQREQLDRLAITTHQSLSNLAQRLQEIGQKKSPSSHEEGRLLKLAHLSTRGLLRPAHSQGLVPPLVKVDLVQTPTGEYRIVEVDTYNPRGLGFVALLEGTVPAELQEYRLPGLSGVAQILRGAESSKDSWHLIVSDYERFYESSFRIFADAMRAHDVSIEVIRAEELAQDPSRLQQMSRLIIVPDTLDAHPQVREALLEVCQGDTEVLFPPQAYLGSKAFLPYLRSYEGMSEFIPPSMLVGKRCGFIESTLNTAEPLVLKAAVSSGLKKVYFSDIDESFEAILASASKQKNPSWVLQEQVPQQSTPVVIFDDIGNRITRDYYLRVTAYIAADGVIDVEVTGRPDRKVHGAPDCIMLPAILG